MVTLKEYDNGMVEERLSEGGVPFSVLIGGTVALGGTPHASLGQGSCYLTSKKTGHKKTSIRLK